MQIELHLGIGMHCVDCCSALGSSGCNQFGLLFFFNCGPIGKAENRKSLLVLIDVFLPKCLFLMARTLSNGVSRWVSSLASKKCLEIVKNSIQEVEVGATKGVQEEGLQSSLLDPPIGAHKIKKVKLQSLRRQYELLSMNDQELFGDYFTRIQVLVN
ncbi:hypothetical protein CR513_59628, partial [Mucuna pruriens]